jgi:hypothetical protein
MKSELFVDGKKVPMNKFVQKFVASTAVGMAETLDDVSKDWKEIQIKIVREE